MTVSVQDKIVMRIRTIFKNQSENKNFFNRPILSCKACLPHHSCWLIAWVACSLTLKTGAVFSSETFYQTLWHYIPEGITLFFSNISSRFHLFTWNLNLVHTSSDSLLCLSTSIKFLLHMIKY
jgi:hypothetical protein